MFYLIRDRGGNQVGGPPPASRILPLSDATSNTHNYTRYASGRTVVRMPLRVQAIQAILLFIELMLCIALLVCGTVKIMAKSFLYQYSNGIYLYMIAIVAVFAGLFANRHNAGKRSHTTHCVLGLLSCIGLGVLFWVNTIELRKDTTIDRPVLVKVTDHVTLFPINHTDCLQQCEQIGKSSKACSCTYNRDAARAELATAGIIVVTMLSFIASATIAGCALREKCGTVHEELREKPPPPIKVHRLRQPINQGVHESKI